ncbi:MAG: hypothetical protein M3461_02310 [Pseudomonadota bacterium]|nr:hypothetical protein [Pseudomonadota bacterium]
MEVQGLDLGLGQGIGKERLHVLEERNLLQRRDIEEHGGAVAKQDHAPVVRDGQGKRLGGELLGVPKRLQVQALA